MTETGGVYFDEDVSALGCRNWHFSQLVWFIVLFSVQFFRDNDLPLRLAPPSSFSP